MFTILTFFTNDNEEDRTTWDLMTNSDTLLCSRRSRIYLHVTNEHCYLEELQILKLTCIIPKSYPKILCNFVDTRLKVKKRAKVDHVYSKVPGHPYYLVSKCSIALNISLRMFRYKVHIYPDIKGIFKSDMKYGAIKNIAIKIERPKANFSCENFVNENEMLSCSCVKYDTSNLTTKLLWFYENKTFSIGNNTATLKLKAQKNITSFMCVGSNVLGWKSEIIQYNISVLPLVDLKTFKCPHEGQHICGYHGLCYYNYQFCTKDNKVESCFPSKIDEIEFCRSQDSREVLLKKNPLCEHACVSIFGIPKVEETSELNPLFVIVITLAVPVFLMIGLFFAILLF
ncbi:uncharacterized protein LOC131953094 [Physella acuta]|uniref:uncharacterized protein LOC131953094 n=1 Tax=Physella acuta TaxID=109671 RepID=UPI0027DC82D2|nr:uncharacterized protein LOC131953094 [Physella acuta]